jgi:hypothetical protein
MAKVFVSYANEDKAFAEYVQQLLPDLGGTGAPTVFLDPHKELTPGENIRTAIVEKIKASRFVVVVMTQEAANSEWVNYEIGIADALEKPIFVVGRKGSGKSALFKDYLHRLANAQVLEVDTEG